MQAPPANQIPEPQPQEPGSTSQRAYNSRDIDLLPWAAIGNWIHFTNAGVQTYTVPDGYYALITHMAGWDTNPLLEFYVVLRGDATIYPLAVNSDPAVGAGNVSTQLNTPLLLDEGDTIGTSNTGGACDVGVRYILIRKVGGIQ